MALNSVFSYLKPQNTYTIDQFIDCQSDTTICYNNLSFIDQYDNIKYNTYNVLSDYVDEIVNDYCVEVTLNQDQITKYKYRPKLLCFDVYGETELSFIVMIINDIYDEKDFTKTTIKLPTKDNMNNITKYIYNANKDAIAIYNQANKN